jgi:bacterioferritin
MGYNPEPAHAVQVPVVNAWRAKQQRSCRVAYDLPSLAENQRVLLEEYAREMIVLKEMHLEEVNKMLRRPGELEPFST